jgi:predicted RecB family nuclease
MNDRLLTPSKITAWLDCAHFLSLKHQVEDGVIPTPPGTFGSFAQLLAAKGLQHETNCLAEYDAAGLRVLRIQARDKHEAFADWVQRVGSPFDGEYDVIYQMPFVHQGVRGIADFLLKVQDEAGAVSYEPVDAKLARAEAKPGHVLQLCFYADAIEVLTGTRPKHMHLWLGSGRIETLTVNDFGPYWRRIQTQLAALLADTRTEIVTVPEPCNHCAFCEFFDVCTERWRKDDSLTYVAGIRKLDRQLLETAGVSSLKALAECQTPVAGVGPDRLTRLVDQATLQVAARLQDGETPPYQLLDPNDDPLWGRGLELMPEPDDGDIFLDFEGHPFWRADTGLFFLFGLILREPTGNWIYKEWWAHDLNEEAAAVTSLIDFLAERHEQHPGMHVYHYNHTERSSLERLVTTHGVREVALSAMVESGRFIDLLAVARNAMQVGTESYGLKYLERLTTFERGHDIDQGAGAVVSYERYMKNHDQSELTAIASYNKDDVRATKALRDWLVNNRPDDVPWRAAELEPAEGIPELDEQVAALHAFGPDTPQYLLGDVLGYWRREWFAHLAPLLVEAQVEVSALLDEPDALADLTPIGPVERVGRNGKALIPVMRFSLPDQASAAFKGGDQVVFVTSEGTVGYSSIARLDLAARELDLLWPEKCAELASHPRAVIRNDWVNVNPKPEALAELASRVLDPNGRPPNAVSLALLNRQLPAFVGGGGPHAGMFTDDLNEMTAWATDLDGSFVAIQGPPGTGKTFRAAHLIRTLILAGKRVGITAMSHHAIDNVLEELVEVMTRHGGLDRLNAIRKCPDSHAGTLANVTYTTGNPRCLRPEFNLVAGTTWLFARGDMSAVPVDVLLVDEAGQLALADALAASRSTRNLVLLGDPLQLPQVAQAAHPGGSGHSVLEHVLGDDVTLPPDRGVFLTETRRMHPDVCEFISHEIYEDRLTSHGSCTQQTTAFGTGLRWIQAHHSDRTTESPEEAEAVAAEILRLVGTPWTNQHGDTQPLTVDDFMVVAPYNDQVHLIRDRLDADERTRGVPVGTVDKFQGRQAAVVFFTMTTSSSLDMVRGADFLFSRNRLNVAISRARCLAYLVCTEELLNSRARNLEDMRLISTLCAFVESCQAPFAKGDLAVVNPPYGRSFG